MAWGRDGFHSTSTWRTQRELQRGCGTAGCRVLLGRLSHGLLMETRRLRGRCSCSLRRFTILERPRLPSRSKGYLSGKMEKVVFCGSRNARGWSFGMTSLGDYVQRILLLAKCCSLSSSKSMVLWGMARDGKQKSKRKGRHLPLRALLARTMGGFPPRRVLLKRMMMTSPSDKRVRALRIGFASKAS